MNLTDIKISLIWEHEVSTMARQPLQPCLARGKLREAPPTEKRNLPARNKSLSLPLHRVRVDRHLAFQRLWRSTIPNFMSPLLC